MSTLPSSCRTCHQDAVLRCQIEPECEQWWVLPKIPIRCRRYLTAETVQISAGTFRDGCCNGVALTREAAIERWAAAMVEENAKP